MLPFIIVNIKRMPDFAIYTDAKTYFCVYHIDTDRVIECHTTYASALQQMLHFNIQQGDTIKESPTSQSHEANIQTV